MAVPGVGLVESSPPDRRQEQVVSLDEQPRHGKRWRRGTARQHGRRRGHRVVLRGRHATRAERGNRRCVVSRVRAWEVGRSPWIVGHRGATLRCRSRASIQRVQGHAVLVDTPGILQIGEWRPTPKDGRMDYFHGVSKISRLALYPTNYV
ncbi:hypothetical protein GQ55_5G176700 [Panicum hallii var. hallii]|uniref:Uncharacterized protein n=1 Tax=Panicum hallii var. hallii TaxID=1504633 RepID=A0A2T7DHE8_9POAL|nr:hypothetical protein GQ55_5G176700 [Panicum hallii var. hallii]